MGISKETRNWLMNFMKVTCDCKFLGITHGLHIGYPMSDTQLLIGKPASARKTHL